MHEKTVSLEVVGAAVGAALDDLTMIDQAMMTLCRNTRRVNRDILEQPEEGHVL